ncbi:hypothetical protein HXX76_014865 [Chlamydomonas incerta]|uniref:Uncharacterized protein n=1 Tax=Chlamydomonas incerta TaxID=51695 RepID=A0A835SB48_CHLIN|nr:hypothetical protein HXX76_014865 [Chlamydomonas incerta]|eukprot:KAG2424043.1 hypothetical protein HXX76_014865 [Chlamydomonas incerta]
MTSRLVCAGKSSALLPQASEVSLTTRPVAAARTVACATASGPTSASAAADPATFDNSSRKSASAPRATRGRSGKRAPSTDASRPADSDAVRRKGPFPHAPAQITAAITRCTSLEQLLSLLQSLQVAGAGDQTLGSQPAAATAGSTLAVEDQVAEPAHARTEPAARPAPGPAAGPAGGPAARPSPRRRTLNAVQLSAALTTAEWLASRGSAVGDRSDGGGGAVPSDSPRPGGVKGSQGSGSRAGLLAPPCRPLSAPVASGLAGVLACHAEVVADANPPEMAAAMWAAARLRLQLPRGALEPVLEAVWLWDPADLDANRQELEEAEVGAAPPMPGRRRGRRGAASDSMGARELCLLLYAVSLLQPDYLRRNAGGFLEALNSYEAAAAAAAAAGRAGGRAGGGAAGGRLSREQVVGVVTALARAGARLDEEGMEFVMQACSCRLSSFSTSQLSGLLAAAQRWSSGAGGTVSRGGGPAHEVWLLHSALLQEMLGRLDQEQQRYLALRQQAREQRAQSESGQGDGTQSVRGARLLGGSTSDPVLGRALVTALQACVQAAPPQLHRPGSTGGGGGDNTPTYSSGSTSTHQHKDSEYGPSVRVTVPYPVLSRLLRQLRHRAACLGAREVCEALRLMAELRRGGHQRGIAAWKEGLRALLQRWAQCLQPSEGGQAGAPVAAADSNSSGLPVVTGSTAEDARTLVTTLHAVKQLGVWLHAEESAAVAAALWRLAPAMRHLADCAMCLTAVEDGVLGGLAGDSGAVHELPLHGEQAGPSALGFETAWTWQASTRRAAVDADNNTGGGFVGLGSAQRRAVDAVLRRSGELLLQQHLQQQEQLAGGKEVPQTADRHRQQRQRAGELVCLVRAAAAAGAYPPADWWAAWGGCVQVQWRQFSAAEAADVLFSLARLQRLQLTTERRAGAGHTRGSPRPRRGRGARKRLHTVAEYGAAVHPATTVHVAGPAATAAAQAGAAPLPVPTHLLLALLAVALGVRPGGSSSSSPAAADRRGTGGGAGLGPISTYYLVWAVERLQLSAVVEAALWTQPLSAAAARALPLLTPRKQVHLLRSATRAWRAAGLPLPAPVVQSWWSSFGSAAVARARAATLAHAAAVTAEAELVPPPGWAAELCRAAAACAGQLSAREAAALVSGMRLRPRLGLQCSSTHAPEHPRTDSRDGDREGRAAAAPLAASMDAELGLARVLLRAMRRKATQPPGAQDRTLARRLAWLLSRFLAVSAVGGSSGGSSSPGTGRLSAIAAGNIPGRQVPEEEAVVAPLARGAATAVTLRLAPRPQLSFRRN